MDFKSKLSDTRKGGRKSEKQNSEIKNITRLRSETISLIFLKIFYNDG